MGGSGKDAPRYTARLLIGCADRPGIVAAVSSFLFDRGANIVSSHQYSSDPSGGRFFLRTEFFLEGPFERDRFQESFDTAVGRFAMEWTIRWWGERQRVAILVSRHDHCLLDLLWRWRRGELDAEIVAIISNHRDVEDETVAAGVAFHHVPVEQGGKERAEAAMLALLQGNAELLVLARYMQILSGDFLARVGMPAINIHHSFLPAGVRGGRPLPPGARAGREVDRSDCPLRHRAARRRTDHRLGRRARRPSPERPRPRARGTRRRATGARAGRVATSRRPRDRRRSAHGCVLRLPLPRPSWHECGTEGTDDGVHQHAIAGHGDPSIR